jgi:phage/plasmid-like protein (TIGR03299 family)
MQATTPTRRIADATGPLWAGSPPIGWGDALHLIATETGRETSDVLAAAGLRWTVEQHPVEAVIAQPDAPPRRVPVPRAVANTRSDTGAVLGVVGDGYRPLQNREAFALADASVDSGAAHWLGAGSTRSGARVHALMRLDREIKIGGGDGEDILPLLLVRNGHDGGLALTISVAPFRLACLNGMVLPVEGAVRSWKARHTAGVTGKLADARRTLRIAFRYYDELERVGRQLIREPISSSEFDRFLSRLVPHPTPKPDATGSRRATGNAERLREAIRSAYLTTDDLDAVRGTRWGALQAVTAYHDHHATVRRTAGRTVPEARFERATCPAPLKDRALALLLA